MANVVESDQTALRSAMLDVLGSGRQADVEIELRLLQIFDHTSLCCCHVTCISLLHGALSILHCGGQICVFKLGEQLALLYMASALYKKPLNRRGDLRHDSRLC